MQVNSMNKQKAFILITAVVVAAALTMPTQAVTWYVDGSVVHSGDGSGWDQAFKYLQEALQNPFLFEGDQIWVAAGTYTPPDGLDPPPPDPRGVSFELVLGVAVYGGEEKVSGTFVAFFHLQLRSLTAWEERCDSLNVA